MATTEITINDVVLTVEYTYNKAYRGQRDSLGGISGAGPPIEPDEPASIDIESITAVGDIADFISDKMIEKIEEKIMEGMENE